MPYDDDGYDDGSQEQREQANQERYDANFDYETKNGGSSNSGCGGTVAILIVAITIAANIIKAVI